jgi:hypothetical protein
MAEIAPTIIIPSDSATATEEGDAKKQKGSQRLTCYAWADPSSMFVFDIPEKVVTYFKIDRTAPSAGDAKLYKPKTTAKAKNEKRKIFGGSLKKNGRKILKYITLPSADKKPIPSAKEGGKARKVARIRVPAAMSINAICIWINGQFKANKPTYFITQGGTKVYIDKTATDKSKLNDIGLKG